MPVRTEIEELVWQCRVGIQLPNNGSYWWIRYFRGAFIQLPKNQPTTHSLLAGYGYL